MTSEDTDVGAGVNADKGRGRALESGSGADGEKSRNGSLDSDPDGDLELHELGEAAKFLQSGRISEAVDDEYDNDAPPSRPMRGRSFSSISFGFERLPIAVSREGTDRLNEGREVQHLNLVGGIALVIGLQVGSGIFSSPGVLTADCGSVGAALLVWIGAGLLAWTGASSFAELGAAIPLNGGAQAYLRYAYGPTLSYLFSWTAIVALKPGSAAIIAIIFGEYVCRIAYHTAVSAGSDESAKAIPRIVVKLVAMLAIFCISALNAISLKIGTRSQVVLTFTKLLALLAVAIMGIVQLARGLRSETLSGNIFAGSSRSPGRYALALYSGLWAYDGWDQACYVAGEMKNVTRDLPLTIHISLPLVMILFLLANISYYIVLPKALVSHSNTVGLDFGKAIFGAAGGILFAVIVVISCFGALNSSFFTSSRIIHGAAKDGYLPKWFAKLHPTRKTPVNSIILQTLLTFSMIAVGDFASLVSFFGIGSWLFYFLTVAGLLILRHREPNLPRPYKTWLGTPIIFCCVAIFLLFMPIFSAPLQAVAALSFIAAGYPFYLYTQHRMPRQPLVGEMALPPTRTERIIDGIEALVHRIARLFSKRTDVGSAYEAVELDDGDSRHPSAGGPSPAR